MQRNEVTEASQLKIGDRFYKLADKQKNVLVKVEHQKKQTEYQTYSHFYCHSKFAGGKYEKANTKAMEGKTMVVFLRSSQLSAN